MRNGPSSDCRILVIFPSLAADMNEQQQEKHLNHPAKFLLLKRCVVSERLSH